MLIDQILKEQSLLKGGVPVPGLPWRVVKKCVAIPCISCTVTNSILIKELPIIELITLIYCFLYEMAFDLI